MSPSYNEGDVDRVAVPSPVADLLSASIDAISSLAPCLFRGNGIQCNLLSSTRFILFISSCLPERHV